MTVSTKVDDRTGQPVVNQASKIPKTHKKEPQIERGNPLCSEIPEWLQEFRENLVDDEIPLQGSSHASSSHEVSLEPTIKRREDLGKHSVHTHFPKDRNCEICKRTKITRVPCRRRNGEAVPRAENFGDLITADHKVLSDNCESRNNHRYAVVVQDLATQWIQAIDVSRTTHTNLDVKQEKRIDDYWNIDGSRDLSDYWTGFTQIYFIGRKTSKRIYVVRCEINEKTADIQARSFMARTLGQNGKECQAEGKGKVVA